MTSGSVFAHTRNGTDPRAASSWTRRQVIDNNARALVGRAYPRIRGLTREPSWIFFEILLPFLTTSAFVLVYRALGAPEAYVGFVVLGGAMSAFWLNVVWMMAGQLYWEKSQGNLELYFAAPMNLMAILLGMAVGGLVMSFTRAVAVLAVSTIVFGVTFDIRQWALVIVVFLLTMSALYGLGMILASLFLLWGREAFHMTNLLIEPVYFVSGLNFPVARLGALGALAIATIPFAVGLDAMRQLVFSGQPYLAGTPPPDVEAADPGRDDDRVHAGRALADPHHRADGPRSRQPVDPLAMSRLPPDGAALEAAIDPARSLASRFDPARAEGAGLSDALRSLRTALLLGWRVESNWTDPILFFIYTVARPIASLLLLVVMIQIIGGGANDQMQTFVILGSALWATLVAGIAGPAWSVLEDRERYRMLKYLYVSPASFLLLLSGAAGRGWRPARWAPSSRSCSR